ncbi:MAG: 5-formyltetrahydrofolate cyclo-ligase [Spirochaetes bacterium]|nr:5-formyltetrahydrofolate cyclo-ligase [Spirochaetota bacterium]
MSQGYDVKKMQRKAGKQGREGLDKTEAARFSRIIAEKLIASGYASAGLIFSYQSFPGEVDTAFFNEWAASNGKRLAYPVCHEDGRMLAALPNSPEDFEVGKFGIKFPVENRSQIIPPSEIELVIVPCVAFDGKRKMRIGMGAGYYDRYLPQCEKAVKIAVAFEAQHIEGLWTDPWDAPLDFVVTEKSWY